MYEKSNPTHTAQQVKYGQRLHYSQTCLMRPFKGTVKYKTGGHLIRV